MTTSKLNEAFWRWFGNSKVVDANGDPLIVYRGQRRIPSPTRFATTLGRATASFTAIPELANVYAKTRDWFGISVDFGKGANVGAYYLSIQNPADLRTFGPQANLGEMLSSLFHVDLGQDHTEGQTFGQDDFVQVITGLASRANKTTFFFESDIWDTGDSWLLREADSPSVVVDDLSDHEGDEDVFTFYFDNIEVDVFALADSKNFTALLKRAGYDGIFHQDVGQLAVEFLERPPAEIPGIGEEPDYAFDTFRPFEQTQVKSATGNRGTWDRDDPDITHNPPYDRERYSEPYSLLEPGHAEQIALELQEEDPDWSYRVRHDPKGTGLSFIEIFDEEGEFVGRWASERTGRYNPKWRGVRFYPPR